MVFRHVKDIQVNGKVVNYTAEKDVPINEHLTMIVPHGQLDDSTPEQQSPLDLNHNRAIPAAGVRVIPAPHHGDVKPSQGMPGRKVKPQPGSHASLAPSSEGAHEVTAAEGHAHDSAALAVAVNGGIDLSQQGEALHIVRDVNGGVKVNVDQALITRVEREGMPVVIPVVIDMQPADALSL